MHLTWFKNPHEPTPSGPAARELLLHPADTLKYRQNDVFFFRFAFRARARALAPETS